MGAYNALGQLRRVVEAAEESDRQKKREGASAGYPSTAPDAQEGKELDHKGELPPETTRDLTPFPLNRAFISQAVLSDELREEIWKRIMKDGKSVREVSAELQVEMSRVGAVVRLKEVEKEWQRIVSSYIAHGFFFPQFYDDLLKHRLVFKTTTWLQTLRMRASLKVLWSKGYYFRYCCESC
jgi:transposase-like protein